MQEPWWIFLLTLFGGPLVSGLVAAWITYWFSRRRFIGERWWDLKVDAYGKIIGTLVDMEFSLRSWIDFGEQVKSLPDGDEGEGLGWRRLDGFRNEHDKGVERIRRSVIEGDYVISREAARLLSEFLGGYPEYPEKDELETFDEMLDFLRSRSRAVSSCLESIRAEAQSHLQVKE